MGGKAKKTEEKIKQAFGKVLFVDEVYTIRKIRNQINPKHVSGKKLLSQ